VIRRHVEVVVLAAFVVALAAAGRGSEGRAPAEAVGRPLRLAPEPAAAFAPSAESFGPPRRALPRHRPRPPARPSPVPKPSIRPPAPPPPPQDGSINWWAIADCESGDGDGRRPYRPRWHIDGTYDGGLQFHPDTWRRAGGERYAAFAYRATAAQQIAIAERWTAMIGGDYWSRGGWPHCGRYG
jgi:hypothetical protein